MWSGFDPLGGPAAPRPIAPITSTAQASVDPTFVSAAGNSETIDSNTTPNASATSIDAEASKDSAADLLTGAVNAEDHRHTASNSENELAPLQPEILEQASEPTPVSVSTSAPVPASGEAIEPSKSSGRTQTTHEKSPSESADGKQPTTEEETLEKTPKKPLEKASDQSEESQLDKSNEYQSFSSKVASAEKHEDGDEGTLRRNSIAAMRELGEPQAPIEEEQVPFDFPAFLELMRSRSADPIARYVKSFLQEFTKKAWTPSQQEKIVADFHKFITVRMKQFEPFKSLSAPNMRNAREGMEKLIMNRLYVRTFPPVMAPILRRDGHDEDLLKDQILSEKLQLWGWVEGHHLDINEEYLQPQFLRLACGELSRIHQFRAPRDKMICILNCCKVVWALIRQANLEQNADSFLPLLIYVVLKARPQHLVSNINYIQRFRAAEYRAGETAYYLSALASAVAFVEGLGKSSLTISDHEFEAKMTEAAHAERTRRQGSIDKASQTAQTQSTQAQPHTPIMAGSPSVDSPRRSWESPATPGLEPDGGSQTTSRSTTPTQATPQATPRASLDDDLGMESVLATSAGLLVERMKSWTSHFFDEATDQPQSSAETESGDTGGRPSRRHNFRESAEERAAREASAEEYHAQQIRENEFAQVLDTLETMFPVLDKEVIEDVLRQKGTNVGAAVDVCLSLVG